MSGVVVSPGRKGAQVDQLRRVAIEAHDDAGALAGQRKWVDVDNGVAAAVQRM